MVRIEHCGSGKIVAAAELSTHLRLELDWHSINTAMTFLSM